MIHEDERRVLEAWPEAKIITAKTDCVLGEHYHKVKTEKFILTFGSCMATVNESTFKMKIGQVLTINPFDRHTFYLDKGSVLIGLCSEPYDKEDDHK